MARPLVIGVGNPDAGDDVAGRLVARLLASAPDAGFDVVEASGEASGLISLFEGRDHVVLIDASRSGSPPGALHRFAAHEKALPASLAAVSSHGFGAAAAIELARVLGLLPGTVIVHAIEGACFNPGSPPSDAVRTAAETLAETLLAGL